MSDTPLGDGWWQASDGKYYAPEQHPDYVPPAPPPPEPAQPVDTGGWDTPASPHDQVGAPGGVWDATPPPAASRAPGTGSADMPVLLRFWWVPVLAGVIGIVALVVTLAGGDDDDGVAAADPTPSVAPTPAPTAAAEVTPEPDATVSPAADPTGGPADAATPTPLPTPETTVEPTEQPAATPTVSGPVTVTPPDAAPIEAPAAFGEVFGTDDWRITVLDVFDADAGGFVADFSDETPEGFTNLAIVYEITYTGPLFSDFDPVRLEAIGTEVYDAYLGCFLDYDALATIGVQDFAGTELVPGQTSRLAECAVVPTAEIDGVVIGVEYAFGAGPIHFDADGGPLPALPPVDLVPGPPDVAAQPFGSVKDWDDWSVTIVDAYDASAAGLISDFALPPIEGHVYLAVEYAVTNVADDDAFDPVAVSALGEEVYSSFFGCFLDPDLLVDAGLADPFDDVPVGETKRTAACLSMPESAVDTVVFRAENYSVFEDPGFFSAG